MLFSRWTTEIERSSFVIKLSGKLDEILVDRRSGGWGREG